MHQLNRIAKAALLALSGSALLSQSAWAQADQRVEVTGSSIRRIAAEGALPVQIISAEQINRSGATTVADLLQKLPAMQGFQIADIAIGSNSGGATYASLHDIGTSYTLVLLNGRRVAPTGSGSVINLNTIPMTAIDRIEVLTDGASALYGSDAIAGVINFILKRNVEGGNISATASVPQESGGKSVSASLQYGLGNLDRDRYNVTATFRHMDQANVKSGDREFGKTAYLPFEFGGKNYVYDRTSTSTIPANATVVFKTLPGEAASSRLPSYSFNPYRKANGNCAPQSFYSLNNAATATSITENCAYDFVSAIDIFPEFKHDTLFVTGQFKVNDKISLFSDVNLARFDLTARIAPNPVPVAIPTASSYYTTYVLPYLTPTQAAHVNTVSAAYRAVDFGTRDSRSIMDGKHLVFGVDADFGNWNYTSAFTWSQNAIDESYIGGYFKDAEFRSMLAKGQFDPFILPGKQTAAANDLIKSSIFNGNVRKESTTMTGLDFRGSGELTKLPAGALSLGFGGDFRKTEFKRDPSAAALAGEIYNYAAVPTYDMKRDSVGFFSEVLVPIMKGLEATGSVRYDRTTAITSTVQGVNQTVGNAMDATTYKVSAKYQPSKAMLFRGSYGTGFRAPDMLDIANPVVSNGVTAANYDCPFPGTDGCKPGKLQYSSLLGGNPNLKPEKSKQGTLGMRFEPNDDFGIGADYWQVEIRDAVSSVTANQAFADPAKYASLFSLTKTPAETQLYWTFLNASTNIGKAINKGVDWDLTARLRSDFGRATFGLSGTYLIKSSYTRPGTADDFTDSMSHYGENAAVSFRNLIRGTASLDTGRLTNTLTIKYRSGYTDINQLARNVATNTNERVSLNIGDYTTFDWQGIWAHNKAIEIRAGIKNLLNKTPPLTLRDSSGQQVGYDPRYADLMLRTFYVTGSYKF